MGAQLLQHSLGVAVRVAAAEADDVDVLHACRDRLRDGASALHEVDNRDGVSDAGPAVTPQVADDRFGRPGHR